MVQKNKTMYYRKKIKQNYKNKNILPKGKQIEIYFYVRLFTHILILNHHVICAKKYFLLPFNITPCTWSLHRVHRTID